MAKKNNNAGAKGIIQAYTDGAFSNGRGGYGAVIFMNVNGQNKMRKLSSTHSYVDTTHNRMEIRAILAVLKRIKPGYTVDIYSDSTYCVNTLNNIKSRSGTYINANNDLWKKVRAEMNKHFKNDSKLNFSWIRAHVGNPFNEMADRLAQEGKAKPVIIACGKSKDIYKRKSPTFGAILI